MGLADSPGNHVLIIGGGIVGISCGLHALSRGMAVTLVDPRGLGVAASSGNAGVIANADCIPVGTPELLKAAPVLLFGKNSPLRIRPSYALKIAPWLVRLALSSTEGQVRASTKALAGILGQAADAHRELAEKAGVGDKLRACGYLKVFKSQQALDTFKKELRYSQEAGVPSEFMSGKELHDFEPGLSRAYTHAVYQPQCMHVGEPGEYVRSLGQLLVRSGATIVENEVKSFRRESGKVTAVVTGHGEIAADHFILAGGAWSKALAKQLGVSVPLDTERGYHVMLSGRQDDLKLRRPIFFADHSVVVSPMGEHIRITSSVEFAGLDIAPDYTAVNAIVPKVAASHAAVGSVVQSEWLGFRPSMPDSRPVIGRSPKFANAHVAFGHGHLGLTLGPITGRLLVESMISPEAAPLLTPFSPTRFS